MKAENIELKMLKKAYDIASIAHNGVIDRSGIPYINHVFGVARALPEGSDRTTKAIALLHDTVEDTDLTLDSLRKAGMPDDVVDGVRLLTRDKSVEYMDYIESIKASGNQSVITVKIADLKHNIGRCRRNPIPTLSMRYNKALDILTGVDH